AGIGVNLNAPETAFPPALRPKAGSLRLATGRRVDRAAFTGRLLAALEARYGRFVARGFSSVRAEWESYSVLTGAEVRVASPEGVTGIAVSSVVPPMHETLDELCRKFFGHTPLLVGPGIKTGMALLYDNPREIGADRIVNSVAAYERTRGPCIVVDLGTA